MPLIPVPMPMPASTPSLSPCCPCPCGDPMSSLFPSWCHPHCYLYITLSPCHLLSPLLSFHPHSHSCPCCAPNSICVPPALFPGVPTHAQVQEPSPSPSSSPHHFHPVPVAPPPSLFPRCSLASLWCPQVSPPVRRRRIPGAPRCGPRRAWTSSSKGRPGDNPVTEKATAELGSSCVVMATGSSWRQGQCEGMEGNYGDTTGRHWEHIEDTLGTP